MVHKLYGIIAKKIYICFNKSTRSRSRPQGKTKTWKYNNSNFYLILYFVLYERGSFIIFLFGTCNDELEWY